MTKRHSATTEDAQDQTVEYRLANAEADIAEIKLALAHNQIYGKGAHPGERLAEDEGEIIDAANEG
jgi:hypothetical protein